MDYGKSGNAKTGKGTPRFSAQPRKGGPKVPDAQASAKADLVARLKATAEARKAAK